ncbi:MAG: hypothetical protein QME88_12445 [Actinomycetota bacterium]|nr:hypothetical protein [Actinomycetota bacterium]
MAGRLCITSIPVGYFRCEGEEQLLLLNRLHEALRLYLNFFQPRARLQEKVREGSGVGKRYDIPKTPYQSILEDPWAAEIAKRRLLRIYKKLNPAQLMREMSSLQRKLFRAAVPRSIDSCEEAEQDSDYFE